MVQVCPHRLILGCCNGPGVSQSLILRCCNGPGVSPEFDFEML